MLYERLTMVGYSQGAGAGAGAGAGGGALPYELPPPPAAAAPEYTGIVDCFMVEI